MPNRFQGRARAVAASVSWLLLTCLAAALSCAANQAASELPAARSTPYLNLRQTTLEYRGPDEDVGQNGEIQIAWFAPTAATNALGADVWWAANFAVEQANHRANTLPFRLIPCWSAGPWGATATQLARLAYQERLLAVIGSLDSASTHLAEQIVAKANLPLISPIATDKSVTLAGVAWTFACAPSDSAIAAVLVDGILSTLQTRGARVALISTTDHESRMTSREVIREFTRRQHPPDFRFELPPGAFEHSQPLTALAQSKPAIVLIIAGTEDSARLARAVRQLCPPGQEKDAACPSPRLFGAQAMARAQFCELAGPVGEQVCFPLAGAICPTNALASLFVERFTAARGHPPDYASLLTFDSTQLLLEAVRQAGPHRAAVRSAVAALSPWTGVAGTISFDGTGQNTRTNVQLATWRAGQIMPWTWPRRP